MKDLKPGMKIATESGYETLVNVQDEHSEENMYDFELSNDENHRYYTNGILSHNTLLAKNIAKILDVPFCICDATSYTQAGYIGEDVENCLLKLLKNANNDVKKAEIGIVFIDEIDKISKKVSTTSNARDAAGEGVQQAFLKMIEGSVIDVHEKGKAIGEPDKVTPIDTKNILFIFGGAFVGLKEQKLKKEDKERVIGFGAKNEEVNKEEKKNSDISYDPDDLIEFGLIPEFIGRIQTIVSLDELTEDDFVRILTEPKDAIIKQYVQLMKLDGVNLSFNEDTIKEIAKKAFERKIGARGLRSILEKMMMKYMYEIPSTKRKELVISKESIQ